MRLVEKSRKFFAIDHFRRNECVLLTCEINYEIYCSKMSHKVKYDFVRIFRNMKERKFYIASNDENEIAKFKDLNTKSKTRDLKSKSLNLLLNKCND